MIDQERETGKREGRKTLRIEGDCLGFSFL
jgi:hypothetical protein